MLIPAVHDSSSGSRCIGCGKSEYECLGTSYTRNDGQHDIIWVCTGCLFKAAVGEKAWVKALGKTEPPQETPMPEPIKPRFFSWGR